MRYDAPLTEEQTIACIKPDGSLEAVIKVDFGDVIDCEGIEGFNDLIDNFFPGFMLGGLSYSIVGHEEEKNDGTTKGVVHVQVNASECEEF